MKTQIKKFMNHYHTKQQQGYSILDLMVTIAIIAVIVAFLLPFINNMIIEARTTQTGKDLVASVGALQAAAASSGSSTPYSNLGSTAAATAALANSANGRATTLQVTGTGATATLQHTLGASNSQITVAIAANPTTGDSIDVTFPTVNHAACPSLANTLAKTAKNISINGTFVKQANGTYNGLQAQNLCAAGDTNTYVFTFQ